MVTNNDNDQHKKLNQALHTPDVPTCLKQSLLNNLDKQIIDEKKSAHRKIRYRLFFSSSIAATLLIGLFIIYRVDMATSPIALAYEHTQDERFMTGIVDGNYKQWMTERGIAIPINAESIVLSKNCLLDNIKTKHLRFELNRTEKNIGLTGYAVINLFIHNSHEKLVRTNKTSGEFNGQKWFLFKLNKTMDVFVLYEDDSLKGEVDGIIRSMSLNQNQMTI